MNTDDLRVALRARLRFLEHASAVRDGVVGVAGQPGMGGKVGWRATFEIIFSLGARTIALKISQSY